MLRWDLLFYMVVTLNKNKVPTFNYSFHLRKKTIKSKKTLFCVSLPTLGRSNVLRRLTYAGASAKFYFAYKIANERFDKKDCLASNYFSMLGFETFSSKTEFCWRSCIGTTYAQQFMLVCRCNLRTTVYAVRRHHLRTAAPCISTSYALQISS